MGNKKNKFKIIESDRNATLSKNQLLKLLGNLPIAFYTVDQSIHPNLATRNEEKGEIEVRHSAAVVDFHPPKGKYLSNAVLTNMDFPIRPDNIMDENIKLRCCFHPKLKSFELKSSGRRGIVDKDIELDIYKFPFQERYTYVTEEAL